MKFNWEQYVSASINVDVGDACTHTAITADTETDITVTSKCLYRLVATEDILMRSRVYDEEESLDDLDDMGHLLPAGTVGVVLIQPGHNRLRVKTRESVAATLYITKQEVLY